DVAAAVKASPLPVGAAESAASAAVDIKAPVAVAEAAGAATKDESGVAAPSALPATAAGTGSAGAPDGDVEERTIEQIFFVEWENEWETMDGPEATPPPLPPRQQQEQQQPAKQ
ncbi:hypothetical protein HK405_001999, partial [Cladochytrium tenue]